MIHTSYYYGSINIHVGHPKDTNSCIPQICHKFKDILNIKQVLHGENPQFRSPLKRRISKIGETDALIQNFGHACLLCLHSTSQFICL